MKTIILTEERVDADPRLLPRLRALFPECRVLISRGEETGPAPAGPAPGPPERGAGKTEKIRS
jgi:hypothetical protein